MYIVEGNIGVGKSTFLRLLHDYDPSIEIVLEPQAIAERSLLDHFYKNPERWAFTLETLAMACRTREHTREQEHLYTRRVIERSVYSGHYVFACNGYASGYFTPAEWAVYQQWFDFLVKRMCALPQGFIYLKATPETCFKRVQHRARSSETGLTIEYMHCIDQRHFDFLENHNVFTELARVPVLILDCNQDFEQHPELFLGHVEAVQAFLLQTSNSALASQLSL